MRITSGRQHCLLKSDIRSYCPSVLISACRLGVPVAGTAIVPSDATSLLNT
jgi:hypothetical protein